jgi:hypothetical protein
VLDTFDTTRPANPLFCHQDFLDKLADHSRDATGRRVGFLMQRLAVDIGRLHYKATSGVNRGWRRSRLGGSSGSHFYAWWAPKDAPPFKGHEDFASAPDGALFLRDIRHHDDHSPLTPQTLGGHYLPLTVGDLRREEYAPSPWSPPQSRFASARQPVRILKGHPGSGKTTALWHAADSTGAQRVLYVTYSSDLASVARNHFERYCSAEKRFDIVTFPNLVRQILGSTAPMTREHDSRRDFIRDLVPVTRNLGVWANAQAALYDELHAHLIGDALPVAIGRFALSRHPRVTDADYKARRGRYLGALASGAARDAAVWLERSNKRPLADRYFPELALAWLAVEKLATSGSSLAGEYDCIAVDECQDLTPIEALLIIRLAKLINQSRRLPVPLLLAGDEAQTVRPTDFEWGWLNDLLHAEVGTPTEFQLKSNLRSPRRIAELVNRVWDLYSHLQKHERPSGTGYAEIDDDATDQILYCTASPGPELNELLSSLAIREGLALVTLDDTVPKWVPDSVRAGVLTAAEAKGLDFHSVCVLDAGKHLTRITQRETRLRSDAEIDGLYKRLAIDQLRVAVSRATERLIWLDINPGDTTVRNSLDFLNGGPAAFGISSCVPTAILKTLEEEQLDVEERIQRCQSDARQYLSVKPEMAWSRALQAVTLLGPAGMSASVTDQSVRNAAHMTVAEICFCLACREIRLPAELGSPDLFGEALRAAHEAARYGLSLAIAKVVNIYHSISPVERRHALVEFANIFPRHQAEFEPWVLGELGAKANAWVEELEAMTTNAGAAAGLLQMMPALYKVLGTPQADTRINLLRKKTVHLFMKDKLFAPALDVLVTLPERQPKQEAVCHEGLHDFRRAAECYRQAGDIKSALNCYRAIPDLDAALQLLPELRDNHPAVTSIEWMSRIQKLIAERPANFNRVVTPAEKKLLEQMLEQGLGVVRRKPAPRKAAVKRKAKPTPL